MKATHRILIFSALIASAIAAAIAYTTNLYLHSNEISLTPPPCDSISELQGYRFIEPALSPKQVESRLRQDSYIPDSVRHEIITEWQVFASKLGRDDSIFQMQGPSHGGYAIIRGTCLIDQFETWRS